VRQRRNPPRTKGPTMNSSVELELRYGARNYEPLPVTLNRGEGVYVWDDTGKRYLDMMGAYSAASFGHCHPKIIQALKDQASQLGVVSRAFYTDKLGAFLELACELTGQSRALPMNSGAEAVETALKAARKWAYTVKGIRPNKAEIISCENNFHGRTIAIISMSSELQYQAGFGPFLPGLRTIHYGKPQELEMAITHNTAAFIVEPIQGEGGILVPPPGYLKACAEICKKNKVLFICDEVQTGLGRTGKFLACDHEGVKPDGVILGKALGGGLLPVSLFLSSKEVMEVFQPGDHGSTFGGNPLSAAVGAMALKVLVEEGLVERAAEMGKYLIEGLRAISSPLIKEVRGKGLLIGVEIAAPFSAREVCLNLLKHGILTRETHHTVIRFAPPLMISKEQIDEVLPLIKQALDEIRADEAEADDVEVTIPKKQEEAVSTVKKRRAAVRKSPQVAEPEVVQEPSVIAPELQLAASAEPTSVVPETSVVAEPEINPLPPVQAPEEPVPAVVVEQAQVEAKIEEGAEPQVSPMPVEEKKESDA